MRTIFTERATKGHKFPTVLRDTIRSATGNKEMNKIIPKCFQSLEHKVWTCLLTS